MDRIEVNTGMDGFYLLSSVTLVDESSIQGRAALADPSTLAVMECLAQLGALHVRRLHDFSKHAFLLKVERFSLAGQGRIPGNLALAGNLVARSQAAFSYDLGAEEAGKEVCAGRFVFSVTAYDDRFPKDLLRKRYKELFACLISGSGIG
jgi:hypothetical protein